jgi:hypothetical protein
MEFGSGSIFAGIDGLSLLFLYVVPFFTAISDVMAWFKKGN